MKLYKILEVAKLVATTMEAAKVQVDALKKQFKEYAQKRELCDSYDIFLADK